MSIKVTPIYGEIPYINKIQMPIPIKIIESNNDYINPYAILNISPFASPEECRNAYMNLATNPNREIRSKACLAYDIFCNKDKYINKGNLYKVKKKDCFYY